MTHRNDVLVLSKNDNYFLASGLIALIRNVLGPEAQVRTSDDFSAAGISKADIIVMSSPSPLLYLCHPILRFRKPHSVIISLHNKQGKIRSQDLPFCFNDLVILRRDETLSCTRRRLEQRLTQSRTGGAPFTFSSLNCLGCKCRRLSRCQLQIVKFLRQGYSIQCIARIMCISVKTVYAHKYRLMEKFDARGDAELNQFINLLSLDDTVPKNLSDIEIKLI